MPREALTSCTHADKARTTLLFALSLQAPLHCPVNSDLALAQAAIACVRRLVSARLSAFYPVLDTDLAGRDTLRRLGLTPVSVPARLYNTLARGGVLRTPEQLQLQRLRALRDQARLAGVGARELAALYSFCKVTMESYTVDAARLLVRAPDPVALTESQIVLLPSALGGGAREAG